MKLLMRTDNEWMRLDGGSDAVLVELSDEDYELLKKGELKLSTMNLQRADETTLTFQTYAGSSDEWNVVHGFRVHSRDFAQPD